jgi:hypothetical protein
VTIEAHRPTPTKSLRYFVGRYQVVLYLALYLYGGFISFLPVLPWSSTAVPSGNFPRFAPGSDTSLLAWFMQVFSHNVVSGINPLFTDRMAAPVGLHLANYTSMPLLSLLTTPITGQWNAVVSLNILIRLAYVLSAASAFWVLRHWTRPWIAFIGGLLFGFGPFVADQSLEHLNLAFLPLIPLIVYFAHQLVVERPSKRWWLPGAVLGLCCAAQLLISPEMLALTGVVVALGAIAYLISRWGVLRHALRPVLSGLAVTTGVVVLIAGYWLWLFFFSPGHYTSLGSLQIGHTDLLGGVVPTSNLLLTTPPWSALASTFDGGYFTENGAYLGVPLILSVTYLAVRFRANRTILGCALLSLTCYVLSLGNQLTVHARTYHLPLPESLLAKLPLLVSIVPARFGALTLLFAVLAFCLGLEEWLRRPRRERVVTPQVAVGVVVVATVASLLPAFAFAGTTILPPPAARQAVAVVPNNATVLTFPLATVYSPEALDWQIYADMRFKIVAGYYWPEPPRIVGSTYIPNAFMTAFQGFGFWPHAFSQRETLNQLLDPAVASAKLRDYVRVNHVSAIVYLNNGLDAPLVYRLLRATYGAPTRTFGRGFNNTYADWILPTTKTS